ncbi:MAG TPA: GNAT family acetyltransferase [Acidimicrobiia bacterium]|nr:GNAT family acetyltransferase [Acidimicrobiia bacterium]
MLKIRPFEPTDEAEVIALWQECDLSRSWNDPHLDIARKQDARDGLFLVAEMDESVVGTLMAGYDGHRGSINYVGVLPAHRRIGIGRKLMSAAEELLLKRGCPKINLQVRIENLEAVEFYRRLGYETFEVVDLGKRLITD